MQSTPINITTTDEESGPVQYDKAGSSYLTKAIKDKQSHKGGYQLGKSAKGFTIQTYIAGHSLLHLTNHSMEKSMDSRAAYFVNKEQIIILDKYEDEGNHNHHNPG